MSGGPLEKMEMELDEGGFDEGTAEVVRGKAEVMQVHAASR